VTPRDLWDTYLPAFEALVREANVESVMGAYNRTNGEPCCASPTLLEDILRQRWGFTGHVVSDCGAIDDIYLHHQVVATAEEAAALAVNAGCDLECGCVYDALVRAVQQGLIDEPTIDRAVTRLLLTRFKLGLFDPPEQVPYASIPISVNDSKAHQVLALRAAHESIVLLKNEGEFLPLVKTLKRIAVIGPNADDEHVLLGNYNGTPSHSVTPLAGIRAKLPDADITYAKGCAIWGSNTSGFDEALQVAQDADVILFFGGLSQVIEGEEGQHESVPDDEKSQGDRTDIHLPALQEKLLDQLYELGRPIVLVLLNGSAVTVNWAQEHLPAILEAWYPGQAAGTAIADVLFGDYNPGGRLPVTVYQSMDDLPDFRNYDMGNRTYRYFTGTPLYPFGYGLSYTRFAYDNLRVSADQLTATDSLEVEVDVRNVGQRAGDEVVQLYIRDLEASLPVPRHSLQGFKRLALQPGETRRVTFSLQLHQFSLVNEAGERVLEPGAFELFVGGGQPGAAETLSTVVKLAG
jgi:beta-glucosidase